jgi:hypothetical protein
VRPRATMSGVQITNLKRLQFIDMFHWLAVARLGGLFRACPSGVRPAKRPPDVPSGKPDKPDLTVEILARWHHRGSRSSPR